MLEANHARSLAGDLPALEIEGVAVGFVSRLAEIVGDISAAVFEITKLPVVRNVAPDQILSLCVPSRSFCPEAPGIEPFDGSVADLRLEAPGIDDDDIRIGIALRRGVGPEVAMKGPSLVGHLSSAHGIRDAAKRPENWRLTRSVLPSNQHALRFGIKDAVKASARLSHWCRARRAMSSRRCKACFVAGRRRSGWQRSPGYESCQSGGPPDCSSERHPPWDHPNPWSTRESHRCRSASRR